MDKPGSMVVALPRKLETVERAVWALVEVFHLPETVAKEEAIEVWELGTLAMVEMEEPFHFLVKALEWAVLVSRREVDALALTVVVISTKQAAVEEMPLWVLVGALYFPVSVAMVELMGVKQQKEETSVDMETGIWSSAMVRLECWAETSILVVVKAVW